MIPTNRASDNYQAMQYQNSPKTIASCGACHSNSHGDPEFDEFAEAHAGTSYDEKNACHICHTAISADTSNWPHKFQWRVR
jgi:hypothetical protein